MESYCSCQIHDSPGLKTLTIEGSEKLRRGSVFLPMLIEILNCWELVSSDVFAKHSRWLKPYLFDMIEFKSEKLRSHLKAIFVKHF